MEPSGAFCQETKAVFEGETCTAVAYVQTKARPRTGSSVWSGSLHRDVTTNE
jgi:hypothetical protein